MDAIVEGFLELVFPTRCAGCDFPGHLICPGCAGSIERAAPATACGRCGAPDQERECTECSGEFAFESARCVGPLVAPLSRTITVFKDGHERRLAPVLGDLLAQAAGEWASWADGLTWIPATRRAVARRGFDHGASLGKQAAGSLGLPALHLLEPMRAVDQRGLDREARRRNASAAFRAGGKAAGRILLVDDVMTTGATMDAAAKVLLDAGADQVRALVLARKVGGQEGA